MPMQNMSSYCKIHAIVLYARQHERIYSSIFV